MVLKRRLFVSCLLVCALAMPARAAGTCAVPDYIRLHVIASDDTRSAQALKLEVRDAVLTRARSLLSDCPCADAAWGALNVHLVDFRDAAAERISQCGSFDAVRCEAGGYDFPDRRYGEALVPAGAYRALRVVIGEGQGRNWWCVLYPAMCYPGRVVGDAPEFHSTLLRWLRRLFGGDAA